MTKRMTVAMWGSVALVALAAGCGGGGGGDDVAGPAPAPQTQEPPEQLTYYNGTTLPGRLMVTFQGQLDLWNLADGRGKRISEKDARHWQIGQSPDTVMRYDDNGMTYSAVRMSFVDTTTWLPKAPDLTIRSNVIAPKLSPDGKHILMYWHDANTSGIFQPLTIIRATDGIIVRQHSTETSLTFTAVNSHADWLPNGDFVFLEGPYLSRGTLTSTNDVLIAKLPLPENSPVGGYSGAWPELSASPDGSKVAFTWNGDIWVANIDGTDLHQVTSVPADAVLSGGFESPTWSPDSKWVAGLMNRSGNVTAPVYPNPDATINPAYQVIGSTGCNSPIFVVPAEARRAPITWPRFDQDHGVRVRSSANKLLGLTGCGGSAVQWIR